MQPEGPSKNFRRFFEWFCHGDFYEELAGDLDESFYHNVEIKGPRYARRQYQREIIMLFRPSVIKELNFSNLYQYSPDMLRNYIKIAFRNLRRDRVNSLINILGLCVGFASTFFILLYVNHELNVDGGFAHGDRIYRITSDERPFNDKGRYLATVSPPFAPNLKMEFPEIESAVRLRYPDDVILSHNNHQYYESNGFYADKDFFKLFDFPLLAGDAESVLAEPNTIVLSNELAHKYFGDENAVGQSLLLNDETELKVTGILQDIPKRSHIDFDFLMSFETFKVPHGYPVTLESWGWISFPTYLLLNDGISVPDFESRLSEFAVRRVYVDRPVRSKFGLQPLSEIYFHSSDLMNSEDFKRGSLTYTYGLLVIALLILLVAGFNFMNISTAQSIKRAREVGVRKVLGAMSPHLMSQFICEALIVASLSLVITLLALQAFGHQFLTYLDWQFDYSSADYLKVLPAMAGLAILIGLLSSIYPAIVMSRYKPLKVLKGAIVSSGAEMNVKKGLLVFQFAITVGLIICSLVVSHQMTFIGSKDLGYQKDELVSLQMNTDDFLQRYNVAQNVLGQNPFVVAITAGDVFDNDYGSVPMTPHGSETGIAMNMMGGYFNYFSTLGIEFLEGRDFSALHPSDTTSGIIINEAAQHTFGWQDPLGQKLRVNTNIEGEIIGVVQDFHFRSLHDPIEPLVVVVPRTYMSNIILRVRPTENVQEMITSLKADWKLISPDLPFRFSFIDDALNAEYEADNRFSRLISFFSWLAICIAGLGLYGLIAIITKYRVKEIGIRKILGASVFNISVTLSKNFLFLILVANIIAIPLAWWAMRSWLQNFTYHTNLSFSLIIFATATSIGVAVLALAYQILKSALANPIDALRNEG